MKSIFPVKNLERDLPRPQKGVWAHSIWIDNTCAYIGIGIQPEYSDGGFELISIEEAEEFAQELLRRVEKLKTKQVAQSS